MPSEGSGWSPDLLKCRYGGLEKRYDVMYVTQLGGRGMGGSYTIEGVQPKWEPTSRWPASQSSSSWSCSLLGLTSRFIQQYVSFNGAARTTSERVGISTAIREESEW